MKDCEENRKDRELDAEALEGVTGGARLKYGVPEAVRICKECRKTDSCTHKPEFIRLRKEQPHYSLCPFLRE